MAKVENGSQASNPFENPYSHDEVEKAVAFLQGVVAALRGIGEVGVRASIGPTKYVMLEINQLKAVADGQAWSALGIAREANAEALYPTVEQLIESTRNMPFELGPSREQDFRDLNS